MIIVRSSPSACDRRGITLTEILIAILILGVGLASLATLFPLGLLRLREAARSTRSAYLTESAAADLSAHGLLTSSSFSFADQFNLNNSGFLTPWYFLPAPAVGNGLTYPFSWSPLTQDTAFPGDDPRDPAAPGAASLSSGGYGLPFAYDPLWRYQTVNPGNTTANGPAPQPSGGYYLFDNNSLEARFGAGIGFIQNDPLDGNPPSAHGLQRLTNFNRPYFNNAGTAVPIMPASLTVPNIFVSPEDVVWGENVASNNFSPVLPDLSIATDLNNNPIPVNDWRYSWMFTGQQNNGSAGSSFEGNIVIFENRPFGITNTAATAPNQNLGNFQSYQVDGEIVVEGIFGYSTNLASVPGGAPGYGVSADRAVLLRWYNSQPDPVVKVGDWIADVTYERNALVSALPNPPTVAPPGSRFGGFPQYLNGVATGTFGGLQNPYNNLEWDNLPAQRCFWYRVQKVSPAADDSVNGFRSMVVYVDRSLQARTVLNTGGQPSSVNAALICPSVVNVIPQTIFTR